MERIELEKSKRNSEIKRILERKKLEIEDEIKKEIH